MAGAKALEAVGLGILLYRLNPEPGRRGLSLGRNLPFILQQWEASERFQAGSDKTTCVS